MGRYMTIFRWKPETVRAFAKRFVDYALGVAPKELVEAAKGKGKLVALEYGLGNHFIVEIWEAKDEELPAIHAVLMFFEEVCKVETFPIMNMEEHGKGWDILEPVLDSTKP
jgi:hypothetical protein